MSLRLGLFYPNARSIHAISKQVAAVNPDILDFENHRKTAEACEDIGLDYLFMGDSWAPYGPECHDSGVQDPRILPPMLAVHLLASTKRIRCITTIHTSWFHPLAIARMGGMLDAMSKGRWGINVVTGSGLADGLASDIDTRFNHDERYEYAAETVEVITQAWSGERIEFQGKHLQVSGWLIGPRPVQKPRPLIVSAGASDAGRLFAGQYADYIFMPGRTPLEELNRRIEDIRGIAHRHGRAADAIKMQMHASVVVRESDREAQAVSDWVAETVDLQMTGEYLAGIRRHVTTYDDIYRSLGELQMRQVGSVSGARKIHGGADEVADHIEMLHRKYGCDGIAITLPVWTTEEIQRFGSLVLPRLQAKGIWTPPASRGWSW